MIRVVDVGLGNVASVQNLLDRLGFPVDRAVSPQGCSTDERFILPGIGSFDEGVRRLRSSGWFEFLVALPATTHVLGICLGMQLLGSGSQEGSLDGLGRVQASFKRFSEGETRVPHMGWNLVHPQPEPDPIFDPEWSEWRYYFTHSYHAVCGEEAVSIGTTRHGIEFTSAYRQGNTRGVQFHPEKSHRFGMSLLKRWAELPC